MGFDNKSAIELKEINKEGNLVELVFSSNFGNKKVLVPEKLAKDVFNKGETYQGCFNKGETYQGCFNKGYEVPETMEYNVKRKLQLVAILDSKGEILYN